MILNHENTKIELLGKARLPAKIFSKIVADRDSILYSPFLNTKENKSIAFPVAGQHKKIYFDPKKVVAGIVTCGGICPGINGVIRSLVLSLYRYGCCKVIGFRHGLRGFIPNQSITPLMLTPEIVAFIHQTGGTILGTSRGGQPATKIVDNLIKKKINQLYIIGGDGTLKAALSISEEIKKKNLKIAVVAIPKTIDNDINFVSRTFGFDTAVEAASSVIQSASVEARSVYNGIGLVKLMGRNAGFIAANACLAQREVDFVLIPEQPFELTGKKGFLEVLKKRISTKKHAIIVVAEGAGQELIKTSKKQTSDKSGNPKLNDIGLYLQDEINKFFKNQKIELNLKYIDPSYIIRSVPANTQDRIFCGNLGQNAVHAAMSGMTSIISSIWHGVYCYIPISLTKGEKRLNLHGKTWSNVLELTRQPKFIN